jgi:hypothetical protein
MHAASEKISEVDIDLPERPESDLEPPDSDEEALFSSDRDYLEQLDYYHAHRPPLKGRRKPSRTVTCEVCGEEFETKVEGKTVCQNPKCYKRRDAARKKAAKGTRPCRICGEPFVPLRANNRTCSKPECRKKQASINASRHYAEKHEDKAPLPSRRCRFCKKPFVPRRRVQVACTKPECQEKRKRESVAASNKKRRGR